MVKNAARGCMRRGARKRFAYDRILFGKQASRYSTVQNRDPSVSVSSLWYKHNPVMHGTNGCIASEKCIRCVFAKRASTHTEGAERRVTSDEIGETHVQRGTPTCSEAFECDQAGRTATATPADNGSIISPASPSLSRSRFLSSPPLVPSFSSILFQAYYFLHLLTILKFLSQSKLAPRDEHYFLARNKNFNVFFYINMEER